MCCRIAGSLLAAPAPERQSPYVPAVKYGVSRTHTVERSFAWLDKNRRLWKNCERLINTSLQFVHLAFLRLLLRRL
nr:transposase [Malikia spinosa]